MAFIEIGIQKVRMVFTPRSKTGTFKVVQNCGLGCECASLVSKCVPSVESAAGMVLCFNDAKGQGITGKDCVGKAISEGPENWIYEINAKLKEMRPDQPSLIQPEPLVAPKAPMQPMAAGPIPF